MPTWFEHKRAKGLRATTLHRYQGLLDDDILPVIGDLELRKVRPAHVRTILDNMKKRDCRPPPSPRGARSWAGS